MGLWLGSSEGSGAIVISTLLGFGQGGWGSYGDSPAEPSFKKRILEMIEAVSLKERAQELLSYDQETGVFSWLVTRGRVKAGSRAGQFIRKGYVIVVIDGQRHRAHRLAWLLTHGELPAEQIDHINGRRDDNRISNLRPATARQNSHNRYCASRHSSTGLLGVQKSGSGRWKAEIQVDGRRHRLGLFDEPSVAHAAYMRAKAILHETAPRTLPHQSS